LPFGLHPDAGQAGCLRDIYRSGNLGQKHPPPKHVMLQEVFTLIEGPVTLTFPEALSSASYEDLKDYFDLFLRKAKRRSEAETELKKMMG
jgi:hypothetical protein